MTGLYRGLQNLIGFFVTIVNFIKMVIQFFLNVLDSLIKLVDLLISIIFNTNTLILTLPSWLIAFATLTFSICILFLIVGRNHGK